MFDLSVSSTEKSCGETNVRLNGLLLESEWDGKEAHGRGFLDSYGYRGAFWSITCLYSSNTLGGSFSSENHVVHLLRLQFDEGTEGFTVSYQQAGKAAIIRLSPTVIPESEVISTAQEWRQPSIDFDRDLPMNPKFVDDSSSLSSSFWRGSQNFLSSVNAFRSRLQDKITSFTGCHKAKAHNTSNENGSLTQAPHSPLGNETRSATENSEDSEVSAVQKTDQLQTANGKAFDTLEVTQDSTKDQVSTLTSHAFDSTSTLPYLSAAETRSLHTPDDLSHTTSIGEPTVASSAPHSEPNYRTLQIFGLTLILVSLFVWCLLRCNDPRWRAERAARREEKRTKRLYKQAARKHKIRTFFVKVRTRLLELKVASNRAFTWDEKQIKLSSDEETLEDIMEYNHRVLETDHRAMSNIEAAEEGRNNFEYETSSSERRRSVSTLPGYESDGGQLPPYEAHQSYGISNLVNGATFAAIDVDSNPDSSVVSTSPRFSRDSTNSDFDEKFEALSLDRNFTIDQCR